jgi:transposase InsO family protein
MPSRPLLQPPRSTHRKRSLPRTAADAHAASPAVDQVNASARALHAPPDDACLFPSQPLALEVLRRPRESAQYTADAFAGACTALEIRQSMGRVGSALDNAVAESFFSTLEHELLRKYRFTTRAEARRRVAHWIDDWYNARRRHSACRMLSPINYELATTAVAEAA